MVVASVPAEVQCQEELSDPVPDPEYLTGTVRPSHLADIGKNPGLPVYVLELFGWQGPDTLSLFLFLKLSVSFCACALF